jgi:hypothetical protein
MPKATRKNSTKSKTRPREGLALIDATRQRKMAREPNLRRELKSLRHSNDVGVLVAMYDAYMAAADAIQAIENQPRGQGVDILEEEFGWLILKAWTVAEQLTKMQPSGSPDREMFVQTLFNCAFDMRGDLDDANSVLKAAMAVGTADPDPRRLAGRAA